MSAASCDDVSDLLEPFLDNELTDADAESVASHVRACASCRQQMTGLRELGERLRQLPRYRSPGFLAGKIKERLAAQEPADGRVAWFRWGVLAATHAAALLLGFAVGAGLLLTTARFETETEALLAAHVRSLMAERPVDVASADPHSVGPWFAGKLDFAPKVRDFAKEDFPLVGGRVDYFDGKRVAVLVYRRRDHLINVFVRPHRPGLRLAHDVRRNGYNIESWSDGEYDFWAVSDLNRGELTALAKLLGAS
jgi:anti-sigma factor RsiW